ncbi:MAG: MATE family efflux transporter [Oscillospiraceae bacterium]|nr:MATE family efflux transporter [Oscillospiraceae bacterium]
MELARGGPFFSRDKNLYKTFFSLLIVITLQGIITLGVNLADNIMLGNYSETAISGAAVTNQLHFLLQMTVGGIGAGIVVLGAQYWGKGETEPIRKIISIGVKFSFALGIVFFAAASIFPRGLISLLTNDAAVIDEGVRYLSVIRFTFLVYTISTALISSLQSVQSAYIGTITASTTIVINICLNYCLIFGNFGFPRLGILGAAIATLTSRVVELIIVLSYLFFKDKKLRIKPRDLLRTDLSYIPDFVKVSLPVCIAGIQWGIAQAVQTSILGHMSQSVIAASAIASIVSMLLASFGMSGANASSVTIGKVVGAGQFDKIRSYTRTLQMIFIGIGIFSGALIFCLKDVAVGLYAVSPETATLAKQFLLVLSVATIGSCYEYPVEGGIIAGGGNTKYQSYVDILFMWLFTIPFSALSAFVFKFPPIITFCFLKFDQLGKCLPNAIVCNRFRWVRRLTRD